MKSKRRDSRQVRKQVTLGDPYAELLYTLDRPLDGETVPPEGEKLSRKIRVSYEYYRIGKSMAEIARDNDMSVYLVRTTLEEIRAECREAYLMSAWDFLEQALEELEILKGKYSEAYERSKEIAHRERDAEKAVPDEDESEGKRAMSVVEATRSRSHHEYNTKPLEGILKCINSQAKLLGIHDGSAREEIKKAEEAARRRASITDLMTPEQKHKMFADFIAGLVNDYKAKKEAAENESNSEEKDETNDKTQDDHAQSHEPIEREVGQPIGARQSYDADASHVTDEAFGSPNTPAGNNSVAMNPDSHSGMAKATPSRATPEQEAQFQRALSEDKQKIAGEAAEKNGQEDDEDWKAYGGSKAERPVPHWMAGNKNLQPLIPSDLPPEIWQQKQTGKLYSQMG